MSLYDLPKEIIIDILCKSQKELKERIEKLETENKKNSTILQELEKIYILKLHNCGVKNCKRISVVVNPDVINQDGFCMNADNTVDYYSGDYPTPYGWLCDGCQKYTCSAHCHYNNDDDGIYCETCFNNL